MRNETQTSITRRGNLVRSLLASLLAVAIWLPALHLLFDDDPAELGDKVVAHQRHLLKDQGIDGQRKLMRAANPEWDFMGRTFVALALANRAIEDAPNTGMYIEELDELIDSTLAEERSNEADHFLLSYYNAKPFEDAGARSIFIDGEVALMMAARQVVDRTDKYDGELKMRIDRVAKQMGSGPMLSGESYPNECWTFCNTTALAAIKLYDTAYGTDHSDLLSGWVANAKENLLDPKTGLLVSSYRYDGRHMDGPEGSTLWLTAHNLLLIDQEFARKQYALARKHLHRSLFGFAWAREWPAGTSAQPDIDSGPVIPVLDISAGSSGLALVGATAFEDEEFQQSLLRTMQFAAFPVSEGDRIRFAASNQVGDAVAAYALSQGPLWKRAGGFE